MKRLFVELEISKYFYITKFVLFSKMTFVLLSIELIRERVQKSLK